MSWLLFGCWCTLLLVAVIVAAGYDSRVGIYGRASVPVSPNEARSAKPASSGLVSVPTCQCCPMRRSLEWVDSGALACLPRLDKRWFWLFYALATPLILLVLALQPWTGDKGARPSPLIAGHFAPSLVAFLALVHCARRLLEHVLSGDVAETLACSGPIATMGPMTYVGGVGHYLLLVASLAVSVALLNASSVGNAGNARATVAAALVLVAALCAEAGQWVCHSHLRELRSSRSSRGSPYHMPTHACFAWCVNPHYTAEALAYWLWALLHVLLGLALRGHTLGAALQAALPLVGAAAWTTTNLTLTGHRSLRWYLNRFGRKAVGARGSLCCYC